jgi:adenine-specific DNA-methyltransferase
MLPNDFSNAVRHTRERDNAIRNGDRLIRIADLSFGRRNTGNRIIQGENKAILELIRPEYSGRIRCIYLDPPYNNQESYQHYEDRSDHETWVREVAGRVHLMHSLLRNDGSLWVSIDDTEAHYLKVAIDKIFGRENFVTTIVWQQRTTRENRKAFSNNHEYLLVYAKNSREFARTRNRVGLTEAVKDRYKNIDKDPRGPWQSVSANVQAGHATKNQFYTLVAPNGMNHRPPSGRSWIYTQDKMSTEIAAGNVWFGKGGNGVPRLKRFLSTSSGGLTPETLWPAATVGTSDSAKRHLLQLFREHLVFDTPKPEPLIGQVLRIATNVGDLVFDAYLGSGTTAAVAHKMGRRYVGIERGDHAVTHCAERLKRVVAGDPSGISADLGWKGGGGFDFFRHSP